MTDSPQQNALLPSVQQRNLVFIILDGIIIGLVSAGSSFISVLVVRLGASPLWVSLLSSIPSTIALLMTLPWSRFIEGRKHPQALLAWARFSSYLLFLPLALIPFFLRGEWAARAIILTWSLSALPGSLTGIMFTLVMGHAVSPDRRAFLMSRRWTFLGVAKTLALPLVSLMIEKLTFPLGYQIIFMINLVLSFGSFYLVNKIQVPEQQQIQAPKTLPLPVVFRQNAQEILQARAFLTFLSGKTLYHLGLALVAAAIPIYWIEHLQATDTWVGYFTTTATVATLVSYFPWARIKRKIGTWNTLSLAVLGSALYPALMSLAPTPAWVLPVIAFNGLVGAGLNLAFFDALLEVCPPDKQARFVAVNVMAVHLTGVVGPLIGALLMETLGIRGALIGGTGVALMGLVIFVLTNRKKPRTEGTTPSQESKDIETQNNQGLQTKGVLAQNADAALGREASDIEEKTAPDQETKDSENKAS